MKMGRCDSYESYSPKFVFENKIAINKFHSLKRDLVMQFYKRNQHCVNKINVLKYG